MNNAIPGILEAVEEITPLTIIRTETALSRFPVHRLVKKGDVQIEIRNQATALLWEVTYNSKYGQPGPLAYKVDTLIVNRRIEEAKREAARSQASMPRLIRLGSLRDICRELGNSEGGENTHAIRNALLQNASAFINAKISYKTVDRNERTLEAGFTRYSVIFTGETLPDGNVADDVFLVLNETYWQVIDAALTRPLDYDYMRSLPPAAQRFYEIVSYQIYAAFHFKNERARLRYSEYCMLSTATRYLTFEQVKKQMYKVHKPHMDSGYLAKIGYEQTTDDAGQPDWWMYYVPGPNASREYRDFTGHTRRVGGRGGKRQDSEKNNKPTFESLILPFDAVGPAKPLPTPEVTEATKTPAPVPVDPAQALLVQELVAADLNRSVAERFAKEKPEEARQQLSYLPYVSEFKSSRGAYLRRAIEEGFAPPPELARRQAAEATNRRKQEEVERKKAAEATKRSAEATEALQSLQTLARLESEAPEAFSAFNSYASEQRRMMEIRYRSMSPSIREKMTKAWDKPEKRQELFQVWQQLPEAERILKEKASLLPSEPKKH